uniref:Tyrosinase copper-binding domain-containing protein n=1 Tax=Meloidogyne javanica TaxID=6303 RepID=A0A915MPY5_MELJA
MCTNRADPGPEIANLVLCRRDPWYVDAIPAVRFNPVRLNSFESAPDDVMKDLCKNMVDVMVNVSNFIAENPLRKGMSQDSSGDRPELKCLNQSCVCPYYGGETDGSVNGCTLPNGQKVQKALRKEIRMISDEERNELFKAIRDMKDTSDYDYIAAIHKLAYEQGGAHMGAAFFSWHNEYCKRYEILVRKRNPSLALHYLDSTLDSPLPTPADSVLFTDEFFGTTNEQGYVTTGPFAPWETLEGNPYITRQIGKGGRFLKDDDIQWTLSQTKIENVMTYTEPSDKCPYEVNFNWIEWPHGAFHNCIGGDMQTIFPNKAANEVIFFFFHSHVNKIFVDWRLTRQTRSQRENDYPADLAVSLKNKYLKI